MKSLALSPVIASFLSATQNTNTINDETLGKVSIIDLDKCDGCKDFATPKCVSACKYKNLSNFPEPIKDIPPYFPRKGYEDYPKNREDISRLTPYNWTFVESGG